MLFCYLNICKVWLVDEFDDDSGYED